MTDPQITREQSDAINDRIRGAAGKNPGDLVLARDVHQFIAGLDAEIARLEANANTVRKLHRPIERTDGQLICRLCGDMWLPCRTTQAINGNWGAEIFPEEQP